VLLFEQDILLHGIDQMVSRRVTSFSFYGCGEQHTAFGFQVLRQAPDIFAFLAFLGNVSHFFWMDSMAACFHSGLQKTIVRCFFFDLTIAKHLIFPSCVRMFLLQYPQDLVNSLVL